MFMHKKTPLVIAATLWALPAFAVDFGVMESADPVHTGDFKFDAYPLIARRPSTREEHTAVNVGFGYGFAPGWDVETQVATYDDIMFIGTDAEYSLHNDPRVEVSVDSGLHYGNSDFGNQVGLDLTPLVSYKPERWPGFKWNGAIDLAWDNVDVARPRPGLESDRYLSAYAVPGAQYRVARNVDVIGEVGIGLNGNSNNYAGAGLSFYFR
jgi:hypothetical protein